MLLILIPLVLAFLVLGLRILQEYQRGVILRLGRFVGVKGPGLIFVIPFIDQVIKIDLRTVTLDIPTQEVITRDNIPVQVNAVCYFAIVEPEKAVIKVQNYFVATSQIAQTTLRSICGELELDQILAEREKVNLRLQQIIDEQTNPWGVKVSLVELKDVQIPQSMQRAFASQAEAERERRAKVINAEGEFQAAEKLSQAAKVMAENPISLQIRYLQTIKEASSDKNNTVILAPIPMDVFKILDKIANK